MKKGFTLVEVLAVIIILGVIAVLTIPRIQKVLTSSKEDTYDMLVDSIKDKAYEYVEDNNLTSKITSLSSLKVFLYVLVDDKYVDEKKLADPRNEEKVINMYTSYVTFSLVGGKITSEPYFISVVGQPNNDTTLPTITLLGNSVETVEAGSTYIDAGATATDNKDGTISSRIVTTGIVNPRVVGSYKINYTVYDSAGNMGTSSRTVNVVDNNVPVVSFNVNGNTVWAMTRSTIVTVTDGSNINTNGLKYQWTTSTTAPTEASFSTTFKNEGVISSPAGVTGGYYLWILAKDPSNNTTITRSNVFNLDNTKPTIALTISSTINSPQGVTFTAPILTASDTNSGINGSVLITGTVNPSVIGTYYLNYNVSDNAGNSAVPITITVNVTENLSGPGYIASKGVNGPVLAAGMTPVRYSNGAWVATTVDDPYWYYYTTSYNHWANAMTADGSLWVWIPRYVYKFATANWHTTTAGTISIQFSMGTDDTRGGTVTLDTGTTSSASNNKWTNHPAFTFGGVQLTGIWVAKFEPTAAEGLASSSSVCNAADNVATKTVKIIPNATSWRCLTLDNMFINSRNMEKNTVYGWGTSGDGIDTHLMKNTEWGAVAYLSRSSYGRTIEVWINPSNDHITGCAGATVSDAGTSGCPNAYNTTNGQKASASSDLYGIFDMSGNSYEYTANYINNGNAVLTTYASSMINAAAKYKDVYTVTTDDIATNYTNAINLKGDAVYETSNNSSGTNSWYGDVSIMTSGAIPFLARGGYSTYAATAGVYAFDAGNGAVNAGISFRPVLLVNSGL